MTLYLLFYTNNYNCFCAAYKKDSEQRKPVPRVKATGGAVEVGLLCIYDGMVVFDAWRYVLTSTPNFCLLRSIRTKVTRTIIWT